MRSTVWIFETRNPVEREYAAGWLRDRGVDPILPAPEPDGLLRVEVTAAQEADARAALAELTEREKDARHAIRRNEREFLIAVFIAVAAGGAVSFGAWHLATRWGEEGDYSALLAALAGLAAAASSFFSIAFGLRPRRPDGGTEPDRTGGIPR